MSDPDQRTQAIYSASAVNSGSGNDILPCEKEYDVEIGIFFDGTSMSPNDNTNIYKLYNETNYTHDDKNNKKRYHVYITGISVKENEDDTYEIHYRPMLTGNGKTTGAEAKLAQAVDFVYYIIKSINYTVKTIQFDLFGYSRGAALARHFANWVLGRSFFPYKKDYDITNEENGSLQMITNIDNLYNRNNFQIIDQDKISVRFLGLFDTVALFDKFWIDLLWADSNDGSINITVPSNNRIKKILHLVCELKYKKGNEFIPTLIYGINEDISTIKDEFIIQSCNHSDIANLSYAYNLMRKTAYDNGIPFRSYRGEAYQIPSGQTAPRTVLQTGNGAGKKVYTNDKRKITLSLP